MTTLLLSSKKILITGGTSTLGKAFVLHALKAGASVYFTFHHNQKTAMDLEKRGAVGFPLDLSSTGQIKRFPAEFREKTNRLDILIHNAAAVRDRTLERMSEEDWDHVMAVDLKAPFLLTQALLPFFKSEKKSQLSRRIKSKILMITSRAAHKGGIGISNYAAAKAGLIAFTKSLAEELGPKGILVNAVNPGFMKSAMTEGLPPRVIEKHLEESLLNEPSEPGEVAAWLVTLCSDQLSQVTGQVFNFESRKIPWGY